mmetsp:Transcript_25578/g.48382  ORF Transcript_25578/g.48382 Transcript_25578/m.48382 type:complete len:91 (-) Transcript_25578:56-328(-)
MFIASDASSDCSAFMTNGRDLARVDFRATDCAGGMEGLKAPLGLRFRRSVASEFKACVSSCICCARPAQATKDNKSAIFCIMKIEERGTG